MKTIYAVITISLFLQLSPSAYAGSIARVFTDHMVIQRDKPVRIWGLANNGQTVTVSFNGQSKSTTATHGKWQVVLAPMPVKRSASTLKVTIGGSQTITRSDILIGDVWFAGGQSNMGQQLKDHLQGAIIANDPSIRFYKYPLIQTIGWEPANWPTWFYSKDDANTRAFSAVAYFFAQKLRETSTVPIGIVQSVWGGTPIETWMTKQTLSNNPRFASILDRGLAFYDNKQFRLPTRLNSTMIKPLQPLAVAGFIWYQGESNSENDAISGNIAYRELFNAMIGEWRADFNAPDAPFIFAQLTSFANAGGLDGERWPLTRESQLLNLQIPNTAMAITIDLGEKWEIHPLQKRPIGERMALSARALYGKEPITHMGPIPRQANVSGNKVTIRFDHVGSGLAINNGGNALYGFETCSSDNRCLPASAQITAANTVVVNGTINNPISARYGWKNWPEYPQNSGNYINLTNNIGIPASPFRTNYLPDYDRVDGRVINIPGRVEIEDYSKHFDSSVGNAGQIYRHDNVDIQTSTDSSTGYNVGWIANNEWLEYLIDVQSAGNFIIDARIASKVNGASFSAEIDGQVMAENINVPNTGGWQTWSTTSAALGTLSPGLHTLRINMQGGGFNFDWLGLRLSGGQDSIAFSQAKPSTIPNTVEQVFNLTYSAIAERDIYINIFNDKWTWLAGDKAEISAGSGSIQLKPMFATAPVAGQKVNIKIAIRPRGAAWNAPGVISHSHSATITNSAPTNLITDPGFESGKLSSWKNSWGSVTINADAYAGKSAGHINSAGAISQTVTGLLPNQRYRLSAMTKTSSGSKAIVGVKNHGNSEQGVNVSSTDYTRAQLSFTTGANTTSALVYFYVSNNAHSASVDEFSLIKI